MPDEIDPLEELASYRKSIDNLDAALIHLIAERFRLTRQVGELKAKHDLPPGDPAREETMIAHLRELAADAELDPNFAEELIRFIISAVIQRHKQLRK